MDETNTDSGNVGDGGPKADDIRIEYHPSSGREPETFAFGDFVRGAPKKTFSMGPDPWIPFKTREDFEFAEVALEAGMTKAHVNRMINLFHKCQDEKDHITLSSYDEMHKILAVASERLPKVCLQIFLCGYYIF